MMTNLLRCRPDQNILIGLAAFNKDASVEYTEPRTHSVRRARCRVRCVESSVLNVYGRSHQFTRRSPCIGGCKPALEDLPIAAALLAGHPYPESRRAQREDRAGRAADVL